MGSKFDSGFFFSVARCADWLWNPDFDFVLFVFMVFFLFPGCASWSFRPSQQDRVKRAASGSCFRGKPRPAPSGSGLGGRKERDVQAGNKRPENYCWSACVRAVRSKVDFSARHRANAEHWEANREPENSPFRFCPD
jgi:hypothetical protein